MRHSQPQNPDLDVGFRSVVDCRTQGFGFDPEGWNQSERYHTGTVLVFLATKLPNGPWKQGWSLFYTNYRTFSLRKFFKPFAVVGFDLILDPDPKSWNSFMSIRIRSQTLSMAQVQNWEHCLPDSPRVRRIPPPPPPPAAAGGPGPPPPPPLRPPPPPHPPEPALGSGKIIIHFI